MSEQQTVYCVYEPAESGASIACYTSRSDAKAHAREGNRDWRATTGIIWILWWLLDGCRMKYAVREELQLWPEDDDYSPD